MRLTGGGSRWPSLGLVCGMCLDILPALKRTPALKGPRTVYSLVYMRNRKKTSQCAKRTRVRCHTCTVVPLLLCRRASRVVGLKGVLFPCVWLGFSLAACFFFAVVLRSVS